MKKFIYFILIAIIVVLAVLFFALDIIAKPIIEKEATKAYGAEVTIDEIDIHLFDAAVDLYGIQATDRSNDMRNLVELGSAYAKVNPWALLEGLVEIYSVDLDGVVMLSQRDSAGVILVPSEPTESAKALPQLKVPDVDTLIEQQREKLQGEFDSFKAHIENTEERWKQKADELPNKETFEGYKERVQALNKKGDIFAKLAGAQDLLKVYEEIRADIKQLDTTRKELSSEMQDLQSRLNEVKNLPNTIGEDVAASIGLSPEQLQSLGSTLLQGDVESLVQQFLPPSSAETEATTETTAEGSSYDILLHKGTISGPLLAATPELDVDGVIENFYWPLEKASQPATVTIVGKDDGKAGLDIAASIDHRTTINDFLKINSTALPFKDLNFGDPDSVHIELLSALAAIAGEFSIEGEEISGNLTSAFTKTVIEAGLDEGADDTAKIIAGTLEAIKDFDVSLGVSGTLENPKISFDADLDKLLNSAVEQAVGQQVHKVSQQVQEKLGSEFGGEISALTEQLQSLSGFDAQIKELQGSLGSLL